MNTNWQSHLEQSLELELSSLQRLGGGDFAESFLATSADGRQLFVKTHADPPAGFFSTEAAGLQWLHASGAVNVPEVLATSDDPPYLALEWIKLGHSRSTTDVHFGRELAQLHQMPFSGFGRPDARNTGSLGVPNNSCDNWPVFYAEQRLLPLAEIAGECGALPGNCLDMLHSVASRLDEFGAADEKACLLHGDLWAGNRVVDSVGNSWLVDPAAHGGHREFDLAMMQLFGGFDSACFASYNEIFPLQAGWQSRVALHQLAPLVVHAIKFGGSYPAATENALLQYS